VIVFSTPALHEFKQAFGPAGENVTFSPLWKLRGNKRAQNGEGF
jgi:hypothetical protein